MLYNFDDKQDVKIGEFKYNIISETTPILIVNLMTITWTTTWIRTKKKKKSVIY